ncbi:MAG: HlyD family efflux transporter periplasmic adaptor subunit [Flavobacteriaceae bacterium]
MTLGTDPIHTLENLIHKNRIKGAGLYLGVLGAIVVAISTLPLMSVDITRQSRGMVRAQSENIVIKSLIGGKLTSFYMDNNQSVRKGDTLLAISVDGISTEIAQIDSIILINSSLKDDFEYLLQGNFSQVKTTAVKEELRVYLTEKEMQRNDLRAARLQFTRYSKLHSNHVIAQVEFEEYEQKLARATKNLKLFKQQQRLSWESKKQQLTERIKESHIRSVALRARFQNHYLVAPADGILEQVNGLEMGAMLQPGEEVGVISPDGELIVENIVHTWDIGWIKVGQPVRFQFDAFPYQQWGMLEGYVKEIDKNITMESNRAYFRVFCGFENTGLSLPNGHQTEISKGMTLTTSYFIVRRNLFELIFDKLEDWFNPKRLKAKSAENQNR